MKTCIPKNITIFSNEESEKAYIISLLLKDALEKGFNVVILDWDGIYRKYLPNFNYYGGNSLPSLSPSNVDIIELITDLLVLSDPQRYYLERVIEQINDFKDLPEHILDSLQFNIGTATVLARKMRDLFSEGSEKLISKTGISYKELGEKLRGISIIDLSAIENARLKKLYAMMILNFLVKYYVENKGEKLYLLLDGPEKYLRSTLIDRTMQENNINLCIIANEHELKNIIKTPALHFNVLY